MLPVITSDIMFGEDDSDEECCGEEFEDATDSLTLLSCRPKSSGVLAFHKGTEEGMFLYLERYKAMLKAKSKIEDVCIASTPTSKAEGEEVNAATEASCSKGSILTCTTPSDAIPADDCLRLIDKYCYSRHWMMHIGNQKLPYLERGINRAKETTLIGQRLICLEIGSYCGYSSVAIAKNLREGDRLICIESEESCARWTNRLLQLTGLDTKVQIITSSFAMPECVPTLLSLISSLNGNSSIGAIGAIFIDHDKRRYLQDLVICEELNIMKPGCVVIADNVLSFGEPLNDYLNHVRDPTVYEFSEIHESFIEYAVAAEDCARKEVPAPADSAKDAMGAKMSLIDGVEISIYKGRE